MSALLFCLLHSAFCLPVAAQPTAFTYQGHLTDNGSPAQGIYDLRFTIYDAETNGTPLGVVTKSATEVADGLFTVLLDLGSSHFDGSARWLEIAAVTNGGAAFTTLTPRQPITSTPYALMAAHAMTVDMGVISNPTFIGTTTSNAPLNLFVNNQRGLRLEYVAGNYGNEAVNVIGGSSGNYVSEGVWGATVGGGGDSHTTNSVLSHGGTVAGGADNTAGSWRWFDTVGGGFRNTADGAPGSGGGISPVGGATVSGGSFNTASGQNATVGGGSWNTASAAAATVNGGSDNTASGLFATVSGGRDNIASNLFATAGGGLQSKASGYSSTVPGGRDNTAAGDYSFAAGRRAKATNDGAFVWADSTDADFASTSNNQFLIRATGGVAINTNDPAGAALRVAGAIKADMFLGMGSPLVLGTTDDQPLELKVNNHRVLRLEYATNSLGDEFINVIGGYGGNIVSNAITGATIGGGGSSNYFNSVLASFGTIAGGRGNTVGGGFGSSFSATVGGGEENTASWWADTVAGGEGNTAASGFHAVGATVGGGSHNAASGSWATVSGGGFNTARGSWDNGASSVAGGFNNTANADLATVGGGGYNLATGQSATVSGGWKNTASGYAATVPGGDFNTATNYAFAAGYYAQALHEGSFVWADNVGRNGIPFPSTSNNEFAARATGGVRFVTGIDTTGTPIAGVQVPAGGTGWSAISDRNLKENFELVDGQAVLAQVMSIPIQSWNMKSQPGAIRHIGPMAQDFHAAFGVGEDNRHINSVDADGVALAAIQGLNQKLEVLKGELRRRDAESAELRERLVKLEQLLTEYLDGGAR